MRYRIRYRIMRYLCLSHAISYATSQCDIACDISECDIACDIACDMACNAISHAIKKISHLSRIQMAVVQILHELSVYASRPLRPISNGSLRLRATASVTHSLFFFLASRGRHPLFPHCCPVCPPFLRFPLQSASDVRTA